MINDSVAKAEWNIPTRILLGEGRISEIEAQLDHYNFKSPIIICDKQTANSAIVKNLLRRLDRGNYSFGSFSEDIGYVSDQSIGFADEIIMKGEFDCVVALGASRIIAFARLAANNLKIPVIAVPLTAGNTTEFLPYGFSYQTGEKYPSVTLHKIELPKLVLFDTRLACKQNKALLVDSALAILVHAIEAWCVGGFDPLADNLSLEATKTIFAQLPQLINNPTNHEIHAHLLSAAVMAGLAGTRRQGVTAALARCLSFIYGVGYGKAAGLLLPHVLTYNLEVLDPRLTDLANRLGIKGGSTGLAKALLKLRRLAGVPSKLTNLVGTAKIKRKEKLMLEQMSVNHPLAHMYPIRFTQKAALTIINAAIAGKMKRE
ncbi:iron-containing alcohol dehydrogenase [Bartonella sp. HY406]|uniref:iron-containing alcohol dehydrogenase n=1 Tax=Bartonella sp. HY406 TaxID=2979331 RepID=UPI0021C64CDF|nr:iron-containing alcohol dehydrogenase [Bartonella sp. HY406]UXN03370.1 iron-containing alcohol dehydrogenase [Bartonella sp. HY406]